MDKSDKASIQRDDHARCRRGPGGFELRKIVRSILESQDFEEVLQRTDIPPERIINPLLGFLSETDAMLKRRAVRAVGVMVFAIAERDREQARDIMRRLIWSLNDESGGIGWGAPEAMGEIMAEEETLALEYHRILVSYIDENGNLLENDELEREAMWGINRLAQKRPEVLLGSTRPIMARLNSPDPVQRGLALKTLLSLTDVISSASGQSPSRLEPDNWTPILLPLLNDQSEIRIFQNGAFEEQIVSRLASELLERLKV